MRPPIRFGASPALISPKRFYLDNESIFSAWSKHCETHSMEAGVNALLTRKTLGQRLFFGPCELEMKEIAAEMGLTEHRVARLRGRDLAGESHYVTRSSLRFCIQCLAVGYHSPVYQHVALARCPLHDRPLEENCTGCKRLIVPTFLSTIQHPFECPHCEISLARTVPRPQDEQDAMLADQMAGGRRGVLTALKAASRWDLYLQNSKELIGPPGDALASRHYQRLCIWADRSDTHWIRFPEETLHVVPAHTRGPVKDAESLDLALAAERVLIWLRQICHAHEASAIRLAHRLGRYPRGLRINVHGSVVGAAMYKLAAAYDLVQEMQTISDADLRGLDQPARATTGRKAVRYGASCPEVPELDFRLIQLEMLGMFAKFLVSTRDRDPMCEVSWLEIPHPMEFAPVWKNEKVSHGVVYRIRARAVEADVKRLVTRKWRNELAYRNYEAKTPDEFWLHNQLDTVWSERGSTLQDKSWLIRPIVEGPLRTLRPLSAIFSKSR